MRIRPPAVAGTFYPAAPAELASTITDLLGPPSDGPPAPRAIVVPHAGYSYSGSIAASAYRQLRPAAESVRRVVLVGPSHHVPVRGLVTSSADAFASPLGLVPIDVDARTAVLDLPAVSIDDTAHALEHSLEVQLPFLQMVLSSFAVVPLAVGRCRDEHVAGVLDLLWDGEDTLVVVSTDLSHYHEYEVAQSMDRHTAAAIADARPADIGSRDACGSHPLRGLLLAARRRHLDVELLDLRNSGDTAGEHDRVVGYGAFAVR